MSQRSGRALVIAGVVVVAAGLSLAGFLAFRGESGTTGKPVAELASVQRTDFEMTTVATGDLQARKQIELRNGLDTPSTIVEVVPEGTMAKAGDVLVRLNAENIVTQIEEQELRVRTAETQVVAAEAAYEIQKNENESKLRQGQLKLTLAELAFNQWQNGDHVQKTKDLSLGLEKAQRDLERLRQKFEQSSDLYKQQFLSFNEYELDRIQLLEAEAALQRATLAKHTYEQYEYEKEHKSKLSDVEEARAELERTRRQSEVQLQEKLSALENQRAQTSLMQQRLEKLRKQVELCVITAPTDGLVVYASSVRGEFFFDSNGPLQVGRQVYPNETLMVLPDVSSMSASVRVHESLAGQIHPGQAAIIRVEALGGRSFNGIVESKGVLAEQGGWRDPNRREYTVKINVDHTADPSAQLKPSMRVEAEIRLGAIEDALAVPLQAVFSDGPVRFVYVPRGGKYVRIPVQVGRRSQTTCEVLAGLSEGDRVLVREPSSGEVVTQPWDAAALALVGLKIGEDGQPVAANAEPRRGGNRGARPQGDGAQAAPGEATEASAEPAADDAAADEEQPVTAAEPATDSSN